MKFYDPLIFSDSRTDEDLDNLRYFGTSHVVTSSHAPQRFESSSALLSYFERLMSTEVRRLREFGLIPHVALGVHPDAAPRRAYHELWRELPLLLREPPCVAVGELSVSRSGSEEEYHLLEGQLRLAHELALPAMLRLPTRNTEAVLKQVVGCVRRSGQPSERVVVSAGSMSEALVTRLQAVGFVVMVTEVACLGPDVDLRKTLFSAGLREGPGDVLATLRGALTLRDEGRDWRVIERLVYGNALNFFHTP